ncbi:unnamed protein product [Symbiodinium microadriaticum]|nr:unnamed protein product [Symbiodinium microadriaticum]
MKHNLVDLKAVCEASYTGDYDKLEEMLATGDEKTLFNGDLNGFVNNITAMQMAAMAGQTECVALLLKAKADPHVKESMNYGNDPEDGRTALEFAKEAGYDDIVEVLEQSEKDTPYGWYVPSGEGNNAKVYGCWQWGKKPPKGYFSSRPGAAEANGFDPMKYGTGPIKDDDDEEEVVQMLDAPKITPAAPKALPATPAEPATLPVRVPESKYRVELRTLVFQVLFVGSLSSRGLPRDLPHADRVWHGLLCLRSRCSSLVKALSASRSERCNL